MMQALLMTTGVVLFLGLTACGRSSTDDIPEWTPADHGHQQEAVPSRSPPPSAPSATPQAAPTRRPNEILAEHGVSDLILMSWKQNCSRCHGLIGRGDGTESAGLGVRDLTDPAWQEDTSNDAIQRVIREGTGTMPAFRDLPEETTQGMVRLVRLLGRTAPTGSGQGATGQPPATPDSAPGQPLP